ncbi:MAG: DUF5011 domain-containing protein, partial [Bacteroidetes bacterium]|nr:DUF5011 domain-containing protein [Bacteroidota bacterium]
GWIDWNNNGIFEASEQVLNEPATSNTSVSGNFTVNKNAILGVHRLRVSVSFNTNGNQPCNVAFGEVEDYLIEVTTDLTKPVITIVGSNPDSLEIGYTFNDKGATAFDDADGNITSKIASVNNVNNMVLGTYNVTYNVSDSAGNKADEETRVVYVTDDVTAPKITLTGGSKEFTQAKLPYVDKGYTAIDLVDGNITANVVVTGSVNINKLGIYTLTYTSTDKEGNSAYITRDVEVFDTVAPVISLTGTDTVKINCKDVYTEPGYSVTDNYDTLQATDVIVKGTVNSSVNGTYTITYNAKDKSNNNAITKKRFVKVSGCVNGISNVINSSNIYVYPNPAKNFITIEPVLP